MSEAKKVRVLKSFPFSHDGINIVDYTKGDDVELDAEACEIALAEGWVEIIKPDAGKKQAGDKGGAE
ncbi:hypothetical protein [Jeongeupia sp. USM3]|uniref:hypothetical protein n=1 Tax=Jeongeupia sp. USM3 TaxID=1906741 RepID=UPI00089E0861|nr:hypothetical protein [Jeongeupia sp. USM3]AOY00107.1 hypothetical protein BJP62_06365 [Jeongeupia sp. USM3]